LEEALNDVLNVSDGNTRACPTGFNLLTLSDLLPKQANCFLAIFDPIGEVAEASQER
jgi:hypothetical protein